jgi:hypothetical protein
VTQYYFIAMFGFLLLSPIPLARAEGPQSASEPHAGQPPAPAKASAEGRPTISPLEEARARIRQQLMMQVRSGSTLRLTSDAVEVAGPGRDSFGFWRTHPEFAGYRKLANETGGAVTVGAAQDIYPMFDLFLDRATGGFSHGSPDIDVAIIVDTSGSMSGAINGVVKNLDELSERVGGMVGKSVGIKLGLVKFDCTSDTPPAKVVQRFTYSMKDLGNALKQLKADSGGDEAGLDGIMRSQEEMFWRPGAQKFIVIITDEAHAPTTKDGKKDLDAVIKVLKDNQVTVFPILIEF